ncbi:MAG: hypothetical protein COX62_03690 [Deltaproteobacteria bacterium CG_4_10_14_0_2_um_filter_43_8]|nr:MAG: hypothetical protein COV43_05775 [Deltaproteobacteria bacterium CG11_big_fil_rev_8_21_14_0_20_42_23]PJA20986.1 MAG: hypothetical protein COX62_03690 [Deltaproteobacteria bacterium CG_4_10_14_0_2_um_filter_43_8]PJC63674.1 MAG: hypothetical protein CO021_08295 [Deltaproteobacteria bacterium CG_4_9_14_0_2_um_filter_42_21]
MTCSLAHTISLLLQKTSTKRAFCPQLFILSSLLKAPSNLEKKKTQLFQALSDKKTMDKATIQNGFRRRDKA